MYAFQEFELDTLRYQLRRKGQVIPLEPKVFDVLRYLVEHHDRVATKREMLEALWPGEVVTEAVLPTNINAVRRALGQRRGAKTPIETVHGRGYRFTAEVTVRGQAPRPGRTSGVMEKAPDSAVIALADPEHEPFVGRRSAMSRLQTALERSLAGEGQLWVITGDAGIGKSRLAAQLASVGLQRGATVWSGQCLEGEGAPAYWPWVQVLREALRGESEGALVDYLGSALPDIAELLPELAPLAGNHEAQPQLDGEQARFRLFDAVARFFARASEARPRVVVLEDIHWADQPSLHLLKFVSCAVPASSLMLVVTAREEHVASDPEFRRHLDSLSRLRGMHRLTLGGLSEKELVRYVHALTGVTLRLQVARSVLRRTAGNPLFVREMVQLLQSNPNLSLEDSGAWATQLPQAALDAVKERLERLPLPVRRLLEVAAVLGVDFDLPLLEHVMQLSPEALLSALDVAVEHRLVLPRSDRVSGYTFAHALIRDALYGGLPVGQRARVHARIAQVLETVAPSVDEGVYFDLAHHAYRGLPETRAESAARFAQRAAEMAERVHAYEDAVRWYRRALEALSFVSSRDMRGACEMRLRLAPALQAAGRYQEARRHARDVFELARAEDLPDLVVEAALTLSPVDTLRAPPDPDAVEALRGALAHVPCGDRASRARLLSRLSLVSTGLHELPARQELTLTALAEAEASGDVDAELEALHARLQALDHPETVDDALELSDRLAGRALAARRPAVLLRVHAMRFRAYLQLGELSHADEENNELLYIARETRDVLFTWHAERHRALRALARGDLDAAEQMLEALAPVGTELHGRFAELYDATARVWLMRDRGAANAQFRQFRDQLRSVFAQAGYAFRVQGLLLDVVLGDELAARRGFEQLAEEDFRPVLHGADHVASLACLGILSVRLSNQTAARRLYELLAPHAHLNVVDTLGYTLGSAHYFLGRLAALVGADRDARQHLVQATDRNGTMGLTPATLRARAALAELLERGDTHDRQHAVCLRRQVADEARARGLLGLLR